MLRLHRKLKSVLILFGAAAILLFSSGGCSLYLLQSIDDAVPTGGGSGELVVNINSSGVKTLVPPLSMTPDSYNISGTNGSGGTFAENTAAASLTIPNLAFGTWTVTVDALNDLGTIIGRGQDNVTVNAGQTSTANIVVLELDGSGTIELDLIWPSGETQNPSIQASLVPAAGSVIGLNFSIAAPGVADCTGNGIPKGYYTLELRLLDSGVVVAGAIEIVRIVKDQTTFGQFAFTDINAPGGGIDVDITPEIPDPIAVTLSGQADTIDEGSSMTITASVPPDTGSVEYAWYLNGRYQATGPACTLGNGLSGGSYRLDVTAISSDFSRAGSTSHTFQVIAAAVTQATLEWDPNSEPDLAGYKLHYGLTSGSYDTVIDVGNQTTYTITDLEVGVTYYIAATAYNTLDLESGYSDEVILDTSS